MSVIITIFLRHSEYEDNIMSHYNRIYALTKQETEPCMSVCPPCPVYPTTSSIFFEFILEIR